MTIARVLADRGAVEIVQCNVDATVRDATAVLSQRRIGAMPVEEDGAIAGIFSERDVIHCLAIKGEAALDLTVRDAMTSPAITVGPETAVMAALSLMTRRRIRHLPVTEGGRTVGFVSIGDLVKYRIDRIEAEAEAMRSYIQAG